MFANPLVILLSRKIWLDFLFIVEETTVSVVTIHEGMKTFILQDPYPYPEAILFNLLPKTYKWAASLKAFKQQVMKHDFAQNFTKY